MIKLDGIQIAKITDSFKNVAVEALKQRQQTANLELRKSIKFMLTPRGIDRMYTSLKRLKYQNYSTVKAPNGEPYFMGKTKDLILKIEGENYNVGPYYVGIPIKGFLSRQSEPLHLFPAYNPTARNRHLHHYAAPSNQSALRSVHDLNSDPNSDGIRHPLTAAPSTCWGSVGSAYMSALYDASIVDMFRVLYIFLTRLDWSSPLCRGWVHEAMLHGERL